jgi:hypothetical protein
MTYLTRGRKYHTDKNCHLMTGGEDLHWTDERESGFYRRETVSPATAAAFGKYPCLYCVPADHRVLPESDDFGHEPVSLMKDGFGYEPPVCVRCNIRHGSYSEAVAWPCTTARVLWIAR